MNTLQYTLLIIGTTSKYNTETDEIIHYSRAVTIIVQFEQCWIDKTIIILVAIVVAIEVVFI